MQSRREYAASLGLAKAGARGKFSTAAKEAIAKAEAEGKRFSDTPTNNPVPAKPTGNSEKPAVVGKTEPTFVAYMAPKDFRFPEAQYKAVGVDGKTYGMRECCNTCRVSLVGHMCDNPTILGGISVRIKEKR